MAIAAAKQAAVAADALLVQGYLSIANTTDAGPEVRMWREPSGARRQPFEAVSRRKLVKQGASSCVLWLYSHVAVRWCPPRNPAKSQWDQHWFKLVKNWRCVVGYSDPSCSVVTSSIPLEGFIHARSVSVNIIFSAFSYMGLTHTHTCGMRHAACGMWHFLLGTNGDRDAAC